MKTIYTLIAASAFALAAVPALAHGASNSMAAMPGMDMSGMMGMHDMSVTVSAVDKTTGMVDVDASGMKLKLHFPATSLATVKAGDKITVHLSFTKP